jgi:hypothetical protein
MGFTDLIGQFVGLKSVAHGKWLRTTYERGVDAETEGDWEPTFQQERLLVCDAGDGFVSFRNISTMTWVRATEYGGVDGGIYMGDQFEYHRSEGYLKHMSQERFEPFEMGDGVYAFRNACGRWLRVRDDGGVDCECIGDWDDSWEWEKFEVFSPEEIHYFSRGRPCPGYKYNLISGLGPTIMFPFEDGARPMCEGPALCTRGPEGEKWEKGPDEAEVGIVDVPDTDDMVYLLLNRGQGCLFVDPETTEVRIMAEGDPREAPSQDIVQFQMVNVGNQEWAFLHKDHVLYFDGIGGPMLADGGMIPWQTPGSHRSYCFRMNCTGPI